MRRLALVVPTGARHAGVGAFLDLCRMANLYAEGLYEGVEPTVAVGPTVLSLDGGPAVAFDGRPIAVDGALAAEPVYDGVVVAAMEPQVEGLRRQLERLAPISAWLGAQHRRGAWIAGAGPAVFLLAEAGLLAGGRCAPPWRLEQAFRRRYRGVALEVGPPVVEWDRTLTAGAMGAEPRLLLQLIEAVCAPNLADVLGKLTRIGDGFLEDGPGAALPAARSDDRLVARAQDALQRNFSHAVSLKTLADELGVSDRTLLRRFRKATGETPQDYLQTLRMESAKQMLAKSTRTVERISYMVGYGDGGFFKELFRRRVGVSPAEFRRRARN